jgi:hypothetical protein
VISISDTSNSHVHCVLGDETGTAKAYLPESDKLVVGKTVAIFGAVACVINEHV